jgi:hypothetical protein
MINEESILLFILNMEYEFKGSKFIYNLENVLYVVIHFNFNQNIFQLLENIITFCFSFCVISHKNIFKLFIIHREF